VFISCLLVVTPSSVRWGDRVEEDLLNQVVIQRELRFSFRGHHLQG
jgi:hypothetical protein